MEPFRKVLPMDVDDPREYQTQEERRASQFSALTSKLSTLADNKYYARAYSGKKPVAAWDDLQNLPILRKEDLIAIQRNEAPFGGIVADGTIADYLFVSPGPIHEPGFMKPEFWRASRAMIAAGFEAGDIVHNTFSYHLTPGAWIFDSGARSIGCSVIPAGNAQLEQQITAIFQYGAVAYAGTPDFLKTLLEACQAADRGPVPIKKAIVSGGALTPGLREFFEKSNVNVRQCYATAELGLIGYEVDTSGQLIVDEDVIVEIVDPETGAAMPFGAVGEVVVTTLREDYPLIRFGTGDLSSFIQPEDRSAAIGERTGPVLAGWLGRADQTSKVRGMFVRPTQLNHLCQSIEGLQRVRLVIDRDNEKDDIMLFCEMENQLTATGEAAAIEKISNLFREICHVKTKVTLVDRGTMIDDGKVIVDMR
ncbi:phenylacetate--CoA ligase family protein [Ahrensia sp. 13_GOM-1096m]|uniref:phenylacetate--CoA ligase family protein n=1 Tax=Ahrensia sp. 13_GOM-1096m TaxID=1380380 RepID=UPI0009DE85C6|nr:AMP-binding protein [Ahrensia sp. 13_GOM-1096m]